MTDDINGESSTSADLDSLWGEAFEEQGVDPNALVEEAAAEPAAAKIFKDLSPSAIESAPPRGLEMLMDVPLSLEVELGRTRVTIKSLLELTQGSVVELDSLAGEPMDITINHHQIAKGEVVVMEDKLGIRITEITTPSERLKKMNR